MTTRAHNLAFLLVTATAVASVPAACKPAGAAKTKSVDNFSGGNVINVCEGRYAVTPALKTNAVGPLLDAVKACVGAVPPGLQALYFGVLGGTVQVRPDAADICTVKKTGAAANPGDRFVACRIDSLSGPTIYIKSDLDPAKSVTTIKTALVRQLGYFLIDRVMNGKGALYQLRRGVGQALLSDVANSQVRHGSYRLAAFKGLLPDSVLAVTDNGRRNNLLDGLTDPVQVTLRDNFYGYGAAEAFDSYFNSLKSRAVIMGATATFPLTGNAFAALGKRIEAFKPTDPPAVLGAGGGALGLDGPATYYYPAHWAQAVGGGYVWAPAAYVYASTPQTQTYSPAATQNAGLLSTSGYQAVDPRTGRAQTYASGYTYNNGQSYVVGTQPNAQYTAAGTLNNATQSQIYYSVDAQGRQTGQSAWYSAGDKKDPTSYTGWNYTQPLPNDKTANPNGYTGVVRDDSGAVTQYNHPNGSWVQDGTGYHWRDASGKDTNNYAFADPSAKGGWTLSGDGFKDQQLPAIGGGLTDGTDAPQRRHGTDVAGTEKARASASPSSAGSTPQWCIDGGGALSGDGTCLCANSESMTIQSGEFCPGKTAPDKSWCTAGGGSIVNGFQCKCDSGVNQTDGSATIASGEKCGATFEPGKANPSWCSGGGGTISSDGATCTCNNNGTNNINGGSTINSGETCSAGSSSTDTTGPKQNANCTSLGGSVDATGSCVCADGRELAKLGGKSCDQASTPAKAGSDGCGAEGDQSGCNTSTAASDTSWCTSVSGAGIAPGGDGSMCTCADGKTQFSQYQPHTCAPAADATPRDDSWCTSQGTIDTSDASGQSCTCSSDSSKISKGSTCPPPA